jgi:excisionase family DNA binding protein
VTDRDKLLLKPEEAAERLSLSRSEVYKMIADGRLAAVRVPDVRGTFVRASDLALFVRGLIRAEAERGT